MLKRFSPNGTFQVQRLYLNYLETHSCSTPPRRHSLMMLDNSTSMQCLAVWLLEGQTLQPDHPQAALCASVFSPGNGDGNIYFKGLLGGLNESVYVKFLEQCLVYSEHRMSASYYDN